MAREIGREENVLYVLSGKSKLQQSSSSDFLCSVKGSHTLKKSEDVIYGTRGLGMHLQSLLIRFCQSKLNI